MQEHGLKISELVTLFNLEVLNRGSDYDTALLTITDVNRPGLQFHSFYDYFDPRRLQVLGKAEITYLKGLTSEQRRKCFDDLFLYDIPALVISRGLDCLPECLESAQVHERTLLRTEETTVDFTSHTIEYLNRVLAPCVTRHGVLLDISGAGVMIPGDSGMAALYRYCSRRPPWRRARRPGFGRGGFREARRAGPVARSAASSWRSAPLAGIPLDARGARCRGQKGVVFFILDNR